jgi:hypothetical protein
MTESHTTATDGQASDQAKLGRDPAEKPPEAEALPQPKAKKPKAAAARPPEPTSPSVETGPRKSPDGKPPEQAPPPDDRPNPAHDMAHLVESGDQSAMESLVRSVQEEPPGRFGGAVPAPTPGLDDRPKAQSGRRDEMVRKALNLASEVSSTDNHARYAEIRNAARDALDTL